MKNFWQNLPKPFSVLSPMENVTDTVFRQMLIKTGRPDVFMTEFVNVDGLNSEGMNKVKHRLKFKQIEKPVVAQIWGNNPENFYKAASKICKLNFDAVDINLGCSQKDVMKHNCGAALIGQEKTVGEIIQAVKKGTESAGRQMPISVKTRIGINSILTEEWIGFLLKWNLQAIILHARRAKDNYSDPANWSEIGKAVKLRNNLKKNTLIIGNGDVKDYREIQKKYQEYRVDGVAIARAVLSNPWCFSKSVELSARTVQNRLKLLNTYIKLFDQTWKNTKPFAMVKKYIKMYIWGFPKAQEIRSQLMQANSYEEISKQIAKLTNF